MWGSPTLKVKDHMLLVAACSCDWNWRVSRLSRIHDKLVLVSCLFVSCWPLEAGGWSRTRGEKRKAKRANLKGEMRKKDSKGKRKHTERKRAYYRMENETAAADDPNTPNTQQANSAFTFSVLFVLLFVCSLTKLRPPRPAPASANLRLREPRQPPHRSIF